MHKFLALSAEEYYIDSLLGDDAAVRLVLKLLGRVSK